MAYSEFSLSKVKKEFDLIVKTTNLIYFHPLT